ncbi:MAG: glycosyltransferase family 2 protein [Deltaproteobacteria bacterium]|nr:glycosyltransferase family 2 protein [Deltaproteobacteria bacterium]MBI2229676.1 glycosyltransferase family 2 protein [Deltaproteobacteria bacterium]
MELSVVVPVYNEEENVEPLIGEINGVLRHLGKRYEIVVVDDGSEDQTFAVLSKLQGEQPTMKVVRLKRNFGQTAAVAAGLTYARGEIVILMDGDGQNDPADIPALLAKLAEGNDLVAGWRFNRRDPFFNRRLPSMIANRLISWTTRVKLHDYGCTLKAMRKEIAKNLKLYGEMHRFIPAIAFERGARIAELKVNHRPRLRGQSKYGITRTLPVVLDLLTVKFMISYSTRPSHVFGPIGILSGMGGFLIAIYLTIQKWVYDLEIGGRPLLLLAILLIFIGFQFVTMGLLGEMLARTYHESQDRPVFVVGEILEERKNV